jgi:hypothetical protein
MHGLARSEKIRMLETNASNAIKMCRAWAPAILGDAECVRVFRNWFPFVLAYPALFQQLAQPAPDDGAPPEPLPSLREISQDAFEDIWIEKDAVIKTVGLPPVPRPLGGSQFLLNIVSAIFTRYEFQIQFPASRHDLAWCLDSNIVGIIAEIIVAAPMPLYEELVHAFFRVHCDKDDKLAILAPALVHAILRKAPRTEEPTVRFDVTINALHIVTGLFSFPDVALLLIRDLFELFEFVQRRRKTVPLVHDIVLVLFRAVPPSSYADLFQLLTDNIASFVFLVTSQRSFACWIFVLFTTCSTVTMQALKDFESAFFTAMNVGSKDIPLVKLFQQGGNKAQFASTFADVQIQWKERWNEFQAAFAGSLREMREHRSAAEQDMDRLSRDLTRARFLCNASHYYLGHLLGNSLRIAVMMQDLECERRSWQLLVELVADPRSNDYLLQPGPKVRAFASHAPDAVPLPALAESARSATDESLTPSRSQNDFLLLGGGRKRTQFVLVARCLPGHAPVLLAKTAETLNVDALRLVKSHAKFLYTKSASFRANLFDAFRHAFARLGPVAECCQCELRRYAFAAPAVVFVHREAFVVFVGAALTPDRTDFVFDVVDLAAQQFFVEAALLGHWGETHLFASRVAICVRFRTVLSVDGTADRMVRVCALDTGLFILKLVDQCPVFEARLARIEADAADDEEDVVAAWRNGRLSAPELLLRVNGLRGRSFVDLERYPVFPDFEIPDGKQISFPERAEVIARLAAVNPFYALTRPARPARSVKRAAPAPPPSEYPRLVFPADFYFNPMGDGEDPTAPIERRALLANEARLPAWLSRVFSVRISADGVNCATHF